MVVQDNVIVSKLPFSTYESQINLEYYTYTNEQTKVALSNSQIITATVYQGSSVFNENFKVLTVYDVLGVIGGFYVIVMNTLFLVMAYYQRADLNSQVFKKVYKEQTQDNVKPFETRLGSLICAYTLYFLTCCCPCRKRWSCFRRNQKELVKYDRARATMRTELDVILLLKELRLLRILALKSNS